MLTTTEVESIGGGEVSCDKWDRRDIHFCGWRVKDMKGVAGRELLDEHRLPDIAVVGIGRE